MSDSKTLLKHAILYDGGGAPPFPGSLILQNGTITHVLHSDDPVPAIKFTEEVDLEGYAVSPGFLDPHAHSDISLLAAPEAFGKIAQGVTTEIVGNCGLSPFPVATPEVREHLNQLYSAYQVQVTWDDLRGYAAELERRRPAIHVMAFCGHNTLRASVSGYDDRPLTPADLQRMGQLLEQELKNGACGLSTGLLYIPGKFSTPEELHALMRLLKQYDRIYATHLRNEGPRLPEALDEAIQLAEAGSGRLQVSHLKTALEANWGKLPAVLNRIRAAQDAGLKITADRYPYTYGQTSLSVILPPPYDKMPDRAIYEALKDDDAACMELTVRLERETFWNGILLTNTILPEYQPLLGMSLPDAAAACSCTPAELTVQLMRRDAVNTMAAFGGLSPDNLRTILEQPWVCCGSDESARPADFSIGRSHPRGFGAFPRFLRMVSERSGMAEAIRRVTSLPAEIFRLPRKGRLTPGADADLVIFRESEFRDCADFASPHRPPEGIHSVWVSGVRAYQDHTVLARNGHFIPAF